MNVRKSIAGGVAILVLAIGLVLWLNMGYDKMSKKGYEFALALISICNREDSERLLILAEQIDAAQESGELPKYDANVLLDITERAQSGKWEKASRSIRQLLEDQVEE